MPPRKTIMAQTTQHQSKYQQPREREYSQVSTVQVDQVIQVEIKDINAQLSDMLLHRMQDAIEGKCTKDGYVMPGSIKLISHTAGKLCGERVQFHTLFTCNAYFPTVGDTIHCVVRTKNNTMGICADIANINLSPAEVFVLRDLSYESEIFQKLEIGDTFDAEVVGQRFEVGNSKISIIAEIRK